MDAYRKTPVVYNVLAWVQSTETRGPRFLDFGPPIFSRLASNSISGNNEHLIFYFCFCLQLPQISAIAFILQITFGFKPYFLRSRLQMNYGIGSMWETIFSHILVILTIQLCAILDPDYFCIFVPDYSHFIQTLIIFTRGYSLGEFAISEDNTGTGDRNKQEWKGGNVKRSKGYERIFI